MTARSSNAGAAPAVPDPEAILVDLIYLASDLKAVDRNAAALVLRAARMVSRELAGPVVDLSQARRRLGRDGARKSRSVRTR